MSESTATLTRYQMQSMDGTFYWVYRSADVDALLRAREQALREKIAEWQHAAAKGHSVSDYDSGQIDTLRICAKELGQLITGPEAS